MGLHDQSSSWVWTTLWIFWPLEPNAFGIFVVWIYCIFLWVLVVFTSMYYVQVISMFQSDLMMSLLHVASPWKCVYFAVQDKKCCMWHNQQINHVDIIDDHLQHFSVYSWYGIHQNRLVDMLITSATSVWMYDSLLCYSNSLHKPWMMQWSWRYFQMLMCPLSPCKASSSVASWGLVLVTLFFPGIYYLVASCIPWVSDKSMIEGCDH